VGEPRLLKDKLAGPELRELLGGLLGWPIRWRAVQIVDGVAGAFFAENAV
jgi:hypothetical protein